ERDVNGWGVESVGTDAGQGFRFDPPSPAHAIMHGANKFGLASLCNLDQLPPTGSLLITPPLKILRGSGSPPRILPLVAAGSAGTAKRGGTCRHRRRWLSVATTTGRPPNEDACLVRDRRARAACGRAGLGSKLCTLRLRAAGRRRSRTLCAALPTLRQLE